MKFTKLAIILILNTCAVLGHIMNKLNPASRLIQSCFYENKGEEPLGVSAPCHMFTSHLYYCSYILETFVRDGRGVGDAKNVRLMSRTFEMHSLIKLLFLLIAPGNNWMQCIVKENSLIFFLFSCLLKWSHLYHLYVCNLWKGWMVELCWERLSP